MTTAQDSNRYEQCLSLSLQTEAYIALGFVNDKLHH